jgi:hypothetical protein
MTDDIKSDLDAQAAAGDGPRDNVSPVDPTDTEKETGNE